MSHFRKVLVATAALSALYGCNQPNSDTATSSHSSESHSSELEAQTNTSSAIHTAGFINNARENIGSVILTRTEHGISARVQVKGLTPGEHGMHFHNVGDCSDAEFKKSGGHINPDAKQHGLSNSHGPDNADLPNLIVSSDGTSDQIVTNNRLAFYEGGTLPALFDANGSAMVIHANVDDQQSQPIGGSGPRVACAVLTRTP